MEINASAQRYYFTTAPLRLRLYNIYEPRIGVFEQVIGFGMPMFAGAGKDDTPKKRLATHKLGIRYVFSYLLTE